MLARPATLEDVAAVGALICASLSRSPSSAFVRQDFAADEVDVGREVLVSALAAGDLAWVIETGDQIAGVALARGRPLARSAHISDLTLLVHPLARERGCGRLLLREIVADAHRSVDIHKLAMRIAVDDVALERTLSTSETPWARERLEQGALRRGALVLDVDVWGLVLGHGLTP